ncbi:homoserine kinase [Marinithermus hydrothermalis]|uniref:Homoserine kinase n=1 Tax=Marinithermus hydrothermalis (strain DSM 14884 / JCM 11576 / T1) TaxID=869210 RepID=F2NLY2_MARHT|nr:homoserine kinase [Marinithermus hydrothermalis]AEB11239.1 Homoserine kinase [Marinithermus hydrothermalis DSM 14884]
MWRVHVPATLGNLGSGFDALGVALDLWLEAEATPAEADAFLYEGEGTVPGTPDNLVHRGWRAAWAALGEAAPPVWIRVRNPIPLARGMGSSAAALVAGAALADRASGGRLGRDGVFRVAARLEGHPDNVAPACYGGFVVALMEPPLAVTVPVPEGLVFVLGVPDYAVPTEAARAALPQTVPLEDAVFNLARAALWPAALAAGRLEALREASRDRLHQFQRAHLMPGLVAHLEAAYAAGGLAAFVGGAGPTLAVLTRPERVAAVRRTLVGYVGERGRTWVLGIGGGYRWKEA